MSTYNPDRWEILEFNKDEKTWYKVLAGWSGGYLDSDEWRISSGIEEIAEEGNFFLIKNHSGSVYKCHKKANGMTGLSASIFFGMTQKADTKIAIVTVEEYLKRSNHEVRTL